MRDAVNFEFVGLPQIEAELKALDRDIQLKVARQSVRAAGKPIRETAISLAPVRSGTLRNAIRLAVLPKRQYGEVAAAVVVRSGKRYQSKGMDAWYAPFIEFGTSKQNPQPFLRPALEWRGAESIALAAKEIRKRLDKIKAARPKV